MQPFQLPCTAQRQTPALVSSMLTNPAVDTMKALHEVINPVVTREIEVSHADLHM